MLDPISPITLALSLTAYSAGDCIGGLLEVAGQKYKALLLQSLCIVDGDNQKPPLDILIFDSQPTGTFTDNVALTLTAADARKIIARVSIATGDFITVGGVGVACPSNLARFASGIAGEGTIYMAIVVATGGSPTWLATNNLTVRPGFGYAPTVGTHNQ